MVNIYLVRHGKTMFNTIGRSQGWSDTPLTSAGEQEIKELGRGFKALSIKFERAYSSDLRRAIETMDLLVHYSENENIPYKIDKRTREWCFGSFEGGHEFGFFDQVLKDFAKQGHLSSLLHFGEVRKVAIKNYAKTHQPPENISLEDIANAIFHIDKTGWTEAWEDLRQRILSGFSDIAREAEQLQSRNILIVSHGMTIATLLWLIDHQQPPFQFRDLASGSVSLLTYSQGNFDINKVGDVSYKELGHRLSVEQ